MRRPGAAVKTGFAARAHGGKGNRMESNVSTAADHLTVPALVMAAWSKARQALGPALPWLALLALTGGFYKWALNTGTGGTLLTLGALTAVFVAGVQASLTAYRAMMPGAPGAFMSLVRTNLALYLAFFFIGFFIFFFVGAFGVLMLQMSGLVDLGAETADEQFRSALRTMLATPYGLLLMGVFAAGLAGLSYLALRLLLAGAATVQRGRSMVFRTWGWTKGEVVRLGVASLATHVVPFFTGLAVNLAIIHTMGPGEVALFVTGLTGILLQVPFILAGHGLAVAALPPGSAEENVA